MSSENLHAPRDRLSQETLDLHHAIVSLQEELDAVDWYRQRADDTEDSALKAILLHNMREEMEHASMLIEWIRRNNADFAGYLRSYLFTEAPILEVEEAVEGAGGPAAASGAGAPPKDAPRGAGDRAATRPVGGGFTVGAMKERG